MDLTWRTRDPDAAAAALAMAGFSDGGHDRAFELADVRVRVEEAAGDDRLAPATPPGAPDRTRPQEPPAVGWATVDAERLAADWGRRIVDAGEDGLLGARGWLVDGSSPPVVLLEPVTEGRLAAALARHGEGPIALYTSAPPDGDDILASTPFGRGRFAAPPGRWGPFLILVRSPGGRVPSPR